MKPTLLIAATDEDSADYYQRFFADHGYEAETATDGLDCVGKLRCFLPDVLVLDLDLLWGGGDGVLAHIREDPTLPRVPVILMAPEAYSDVPADLLASPVVAWLKKPVRLKALVEQVCEVWTNYGAELAPAANF
jgi:chemosensory pili system protein ChpA (sensor histidine kinase/response regulator)